MTHTAHPDPADLALLDAIAGGLPLVPRPYEAAGERLGMSETQVRERLGRLLADGTVRRLGVVVRHRELGYGANAMVVWALPEDRVSELGNRIGAMPFVTLSYRRPTRPGWPYNLFTMIHGRDRDAVLAQLDRIKAICALESVDCAVLFSGRCFKQRGARYAAGPGSRAERQPEDPPSEPNARSRPCLANPQSGAADPDRPASRT